jgi:hypothetical protein
MKLTLSITLVLIAALASPYAHAGKVEDVQTAMKKACGKDVPNDEALRFVKDLFLSCVAKSKVDIAGCKVDCLKGAGGAEMGQ